MNAMNGKSRVYKMAVWGHLEDVFAASLAIAARLEVYSRHDHSHVEDRALAECTTLGEPSNTRADHSGRLPWGCSTISPRLSSISVNVHLSPDRR